MDTTNLEAALLAADHRRRQAMINGDLATLAEVLSPDLVWTHSSGKSEGRDAVIATIAAGAVVYHSIDLTESRVRVFGELLLHHGVINGRVTRDGTDRPLRNRFLSAWCRSGTGLTLVAWQSTGL